MRTFLLLAGRSTRFWPLTEKTLFPICGKTLLEHQVERLQKAGCTDIVLIGGAHNLEETRTIFPDMPTVEQKDLNLGMRGAMLSILEKYPSDPLMIVSGNDVVDPSVYTAAVRSEGNGAIVAYNVETYFPGGYLTIENEKVLSIIEKPGEGNEPSSMVNIAIHVHRDPQALGEALQNVDERTDDGYEQALAKLFETHTYTAIPYNGPWQAVKYPWHMLNLCEMLLEEISEPRIHPSADIANSAEIIGNVIIEEGVRVLHNAVIRGPAYIGKQSIVANNALVRNASIGDNCIVGFTTEIKSSVLHSDVWTHMNYIGDSVIGENVSFGAGTMTGNLRLDEGEISSEIKGEKIQTGKTKFGTVVGNDCRLGIHVSINPGVKIGSGTFIGSKALIEKDVPDCRFAVQKEGILTIRENSAPISTPDSREKFRKKV